MNIKPINILLVDDNEDDVILTEEAMIDSCFLNMMHAVFDGVEALAYLRQEGKYEGAQRPGLIMLDINMPGMSGFDVLKEIKTDPDLADIPIVMLTTSKRDEDITQSYAKGACSFVSKSVDFNRLREVVQQFGLYWSLVVQLPSEQR